MVLRQLLNVMRISKPTPAALCPASALLSALLTPGALHAPHLPRMCGKFFCHSCCFKRMLLPPKFAVREPQRVCELWRSLLAPQQTFLAGTQAAAVQPEHGLGVAAFVAQQSLEQQLGEVGHLQGACVEEADWAVGSRRRCLPCCSSLEKGPSTKY